MRKWPCATQDDSYCNRSTREYPLPAVRPGNSLLSNDKLMQTFALRLPDWDESLALRMDAD